MIDQCKKSGADVVKFQIHFADESTLDEKFRINSLLKIKLDLIIGKEHHLHHYNGKNFKYCQKKN